MRKQKTFSQGEEICFSYFSHDLLKLSSVLYNCKDTYITFSFLCYVSAELNGLAKENNFFIARTKEAMCLTKMVILFG